MSNVLVHPAIRSNLRKLAQLEKQTGLHARFRQGKTGVLLCVQQPQNNSTPPTAA